MVTWNEFMASDPELAGVIQSLLCQYGPGYGYQATVRADGGPRVHPVSPIVTDAGLYCFIVPSPKRRDLNRDGRYALHSFPADDTSAEAYVSGRATPVTSPDLRATLAQTSHANADVNWEIFELTIDVAMVSAPGRRATIWHDPATLPGVVRLHQRRTNGPCTPAADSVQ
jgi:hypothetical protein